MVVQLEPRRRFTETVISKAPLIQHVLGTRFLLGITRRALNNVTCSVKTARGVDKSLQTSIYALQRCVHGLEYNDTRTSFIVTGNQPGGERASVLEWTILRLSHTVLDSLLLVHR
jgi:hypothetical protein